MNKGSTASVIDIFDWDSYNAGYIKGYEECKADYRRRIRERRESKYAERRRWLYFLKQKVIGVLLLVATVIMVKVLEGDATIALFTVPVSLMLIFSREKCWMDQYYFDTEEDRS